MDAAVLLSGCEADGLWRYRMYRKSLLFKNIVKEIFPAKAGQDYVNFIAAPSGWSHHDIAAARVGRDLQTHSPAHDCPRTGPLNVRTLRHELPAIFSH